MAPDHNDDDESSEVIFASPSPRSRWTPSALSAWFQNTSHDHDENKEEEQQQRRPRVTSSPQKSKATTRLAISLFLSPAIFPTLVQLHLLWAVRLIAGEIEGNKHAIRKARNSATRQGNSTALLSTFFALATATAIILHSFTAKKLQEIAADAVAGSETFSDPSTLFPSYWILLIESIPTWLSLVPLLLLASDGTRIPLQVKVPSPSHLPSLLELMPSWLRAPLRPSDRYTARRSALLASRARRHGALGLPGPPPPLVAPQTQAGRYALGSMTRLEEDSSSADVAFTESVDSHSVSHDTPASSRPQSVDHSRAQSMHSVDVSSTEGDTTVRDASNGTPLWTALGSGDGPSREAQRVLHLQQAMVDELERAGRLPEQQRSSALAASPLSSGSSTSTTALDGKSLHQRNQKVQLPSLYALSVASTLVSSLSLIACYSIVTLKLPNLAPTSVPAIVALLALRAEIGGLVKYWNEERRRVEGLEFVRRRWGVDDKTDVRDGGGSDGSCCAICFEPITWGDEGDDLEGAADGVRLDCQHELHAPCLVPWLMSQSFCPVCHRPLRPGVGGGSSRSGSVRSGHHHHHHHRHRRHARSRTSSRHSHHQQQQQQHQQHPDGSTPTPTPQTGGG